MAPAPEPARAVFTLEGAIPPRRIPWMYRVTLGLTALVMVLLPLLYVLERALAACPTAAPAPLTA